MRWRGRRQSSNIEDRRGAGGGFGAPMGLPGGIRGSGLGGFGLVAFIVIALALGVDPSQILVPGGTTYHPSSQSRLPTEQEAQLREFVGVVLADTEDVWRKQFAARGATYREPRLVLFTGVSSSGCGTATEAVGPFYCPSDERVYFDLSFLNDLSNQFGAPGDFAQAYVIAHEVGHHLQNIMGVLDTRSSAAGATGASVRTELQADCFAGIWAHDADKSLGVLESGDIDEALGAASAVGDDRLQREAQGRVVPDAFTHGTSEQRARWFKIGYQSGKLEACDTFNARTL